jgi:hypothetical protein
LKNPSITIIAEADKLLLASRSLNYAKIGAHDLEEVAKLRAALLDLKISNSNDDAIDSYAIRQVTRNSDLGGGSKFLYQDDKEIKERRSRVCESLGNEGFEDRVSQVYNSFVGSRRMRIDEVPHRVGLPEFDVVIAPDFAPNPGLHGIFISSKAVMSITLALDESEDGKRWKVLKRKEFSSEDEMVECATLMSAGFDVPD